MKWLLEAKVSVVDVVSRKVSVIRRGGTEGEVVAKMVVAFFAKTALSTPNAGLNGHFVAWLEVLYGFSALHYSTRGFMT